MRKFLDKIKSKWRDNKAEFLLQVLSFALASTLLVMGFTITPSAQTSTVADDNLVSVGEYELKLPTSFQYTNFEISVDFKLTYFDIYCNKIRVRAINGENVVDYYITTSNESGVPSNAYITVAEGDYKFKLFYIDIQTAQTLSEHDYVRFNDIFGLYTPNVPDDGEFTITRGAYIADGDYTFPNEFITGQLNFTSYDRLTGDTLYFSAIRIGVSNDIAYIDYFDVEDNDWFSVYVDGWMLDSFQSITVLDTALVSEEFYLKFEQIFSPASDFEAGFAAGYDEGYWDGKEVGRDEGYRQGYLQGIDDAGGEHGGFIGGIITGVFDGLDGCYIYAGYSILDLIKTIVGIFGAIWLLKLLAGG